jgi:cytochrome bd ubiquinol oxidase subunit I
LNDLFFARSQMGMSLAFHIVFAVIGMAMPLLMAVSEGCYLWTKKPIFLELSKRWAAGRKLKFTDGHLRQSPLRVGGNDTFRTGIKHSFC